MILKKNDIKICKKFYFSNNTFSLTFLIHHNLLEKLIKKIYNTKIISD